MIVLAIDPGQSGALVALDSQSPRVPTFYDMPLQPEFFKTKKNPQKRVDARELQKFLLPYLEVDHHLGLERIWGFGQCINGAQTGQFTFAKDLGIVTATIELTGIRHTLVEPQVWQKAVGKKCGSDKTESITRAIQLFPAAELRKPGSKVYSHDRADALLIAYYTLQTQI